MIHCSFLIDPMPHQKITQQLDKLGIEYIWHDHDAVFTCADAAKIYTPAMGTQTKNVFLRNKKGDRHFLVTLTADKKIDLQALRRLPEVDSSKLSFGSPERLKARLNVTPGSVSPFGLVHDEENEVEFFLDADLLSPQKMHFHPNLNTASLQVTSEDLQKFLDSLPHQWQAIRIPTL